MKKTRMLSISSMMAAMCVAILSVGCLIESLDVTLSIIAGLVVMILAAEYGFRVGIAVYLVAGLLSLRLPVNSSGILFLAFSGWYPIVQKKINMLRPFLSRLVKTLLFNVVLVLLLVLSAFVTGLVEQTLIYLSLFVFGNLAFFLYDLLLDRFFIWYLMKLRHRLKF